MSRYIDIEPIEKEIERELTIGEIMPLSEHQKGALDVYSAIKKTPTADVEEVRHGRWLPLIQRYHWADVRTVSSGIIGFYCSLCGTEEKFKYRYCHCGAKMDKEKEE